jgi:dual-specificity kinase
MALRELSGTVFARLTWPQRRVGRALSGRCGWLCCGFADKILAKVGEGTFGRVLECWDRTLKRYCAIKVIRNVQKYRDASMMEIDALQRIAAADPKGRWHNVALQEWLDYRGHICMVFEKLGLSLYDFLRKNHYQPFSIELVREFGAQLLEVRSLTLPAVSPLSPWLPPSRILPLSRILRLS